ncbi:restriction endonuclease subunit S [Paraburkholderia terricola]|uniref:restriction endonuclease subunit S n=1 Tax=Paraburkholderia terricola TaxID=169427 RepID=UPI002857520D|nr:restriction endonuclease subunit S [Paraburkholderia terricola]MDR6482853.1 type I restriction enzyme S subunit [Paraburkholderia terricola]
MSSSQPHGWQTSCLEEVTFAIGGGTPSKAEPKFWFGGTIPWVSPKDMKARLITDSEDHVTEAALGRLSVVPAESVLVVVRSGILSHTLPVALTKVPVTVNQDMRAFVPLLDISPSYLAWQLIAMEQEILDKCSKDGTTVASIEGPSLARFPLRIAPVAEQTRIVAKLEELLSDLETGVAELKAARKKLQQYRQSLLKAAVGGALTAHWREAQRELARPTETGAQLLQRILTERRARWEAKQLTKFNEQGKAPPKDWQKKYPEPVRLDITALPALPDGWVWANLDQLVAESSYGTSVKCDYESDGTPVLRIPNVSGGRLDLRDMKFSTTDLGLEKHEFLAVGDVLVTRTNGSISLVGRAAAVVSELPTAHYFASYLLRLRCVEVSCVHLWILAVLTGHAGRQWLEARAASSAGQHNISLSTLLTMPVPLPPLGEQIAILAELEVSRESTERQEAAAELSIKQSTAQRRNVLRAAFAGQLVPQDPNDELANVLLERIREERAERAKQPKARKTTQKKEIAAVVSQLIDVLAEAGDWVPAQEAFRRCGVADGAQTDQIEALYAELRALDKAGRLAVEPVADAKGRKLYDKLKLLAG